MSNLTKVDNFEKFFDNLKDQQNKSMLVPYKNNINKLSNLCLPKEYIKILKDVNKHNIGMDKLKLIPLATASKYEIKEYNLLAKMRSINYIGFNKDDAIYSISPLGQEVLDSAKSSTKGYEQKSSKYSSICLIYLGLGIIIGLCFLLSIPISLIYSSILGLITVLLLLAACFFESKWLRFDDLHYKKQKISAKICIPILKKHLIIDCARILLTLVKEMNCTLFFCNELIIINSMLVKIF